MDIINLETTCTTCDGYGEIVDYKMSTKDTTVPNECAKCHGTGLMLTVKGESFMELIARYLPYYTRQNRNG